MSAEHAPRALAIEAGALARAAEGLGEALLVLGPDWRILAANAAALRIDGRSRAELIGRHLLEAWPEARTAPTWRAYQRAVRKREPVELVYRHRSATHDIFLEVRAYPLESGLAVLYRDVTARELANEAARKSTEILEGFVRAVPGVVYAKDRQGRLLIANQGTMDLIGKPLPAVIGKTDAEFLDDPAQAAAIMATDARIMASGIGEQVEEAVDLADGEWAVWLSTKEPLRNEAGEVVGLIGSSVDITARKRIEAELAEALEQKEALLYEVNHRVRNNLQMITALLSLQERQTSSPEARRDLAEARARIAVVGALHQNLYTSAAHSTVEIVGFVEELARATLSSLGAGRPVALAVQRSGTRQVSLKEATPLALIVGELLTNALKYAFSDGRAGTIRVAVTVQPDRLHLEIADDGVGLPAEFRLSEPKGVGTRIIQVLARQLRATIAVQAEERGACFVIDVPLSQNADS